MSVKLDNRGFFLHLTSDIKNLEKDGIPETNITKQKVKSDTGNK